VTSASEKKMRKIILIIFTIFVVFVEKSHLYTSSRHSSLSQHQREENEPITIGEWNFHLARSPV
jgi:hypothetical protein